ncbi:MAG: nucleotidyltransferase domain-containing protein [Polyangiaceae bacterium]|nr:nucleotidyltransferase domain-containing protein [Polyangiaceae bacterium]
MDEQGSHIVDAVRSNFPDVFTIYRFGSFQRGDATVASDVDIAILGPYPLARVTCWELAHHVAARLGRDVDIVDMRTTTSVLRVQVLEHGLVLYDAAPRERAAFETRALSEYAHLNEERRDILLDIAERGTVHG